MRQHALSSVTKRLAVIAFAVAAAVTWMGTAPGFADGAIRWHGCGPEQPSSLQCGELSVPLDYHHPHGAKITLGSTGFGPLTGRIGSAASSSIPGDRGAQAASSLRWRRPAAISGTPPCTSAST